MSLLRLSSLEIDDEILDITAGLIARHGPKLTSAQAVADAAGYSKAAIFARFGNKERLVVAAVERCIALAHSTSSTVASLAPGAKRDTAALEALWDVGTAHPGFIALALASLTNLHGTDTQRRLGPVEETIFAMFDDTVSQDSAREQRVLAVIGALSALAVLLLTYPRITGDEQLARRTAIHAARSALA